MVVRSLCPFKAINTKDPRYISFASRSVAMPRSLRAVLNSARFLLGSSAVVPIIIVFSSNRLMYPKFKKLQRLVVGSFANRLKSKKRKRDEK